MTPVTQTSTTLNESLFTPDPIDVQVGLRVRNRRKDMKINQATLAAELGVSFQQVQKYERGANRISASTLMRISRVLKTPASWLLGEADGSPVLDDTVTKVIRMPRGHALLRLAGGLPADRMDALIRVAEALQVAA